MQTLNTAATVVKVPLKTAALVAVDNIAEAPALTC